MLAQLALVAALASVSPTVQFSADDMNDMRVQASIDDITPLATQAGQTWQHNVIVSPDRFNHVYMGTMHVRIAMPEEILKACGPAAWACTTKVADSECWVTLPAMTPVQILSGLLEANYYHERAHCEGWPANHPN